MSKDELAINWRGKATDYFAESERHSGDIANEFALCSIAASLIRIGDLLETAGTTAEAQRKLQEIIVARLPKET